MTSELIMMNAKTKVIPLCNNIVLLGDSKVIDSTYAALKKFVLIFTKFSLL